MNKLSLSASIPVATDSPSLPALSGLSASTRIQNTTGLISRLWNWIRERQAARSSTRRLHVASAVSLGEKRFIALIQIDEQQFLVGGGATNVSLLAWLDTKESFGEQLNDTMTRLEKQPVKRTRNRVAKLPANSAGKTA